jgi:hypothetical protein
MFPSSRFLVPASVVLSLAFLAGCGGSGNSFVAPTPPPSGSFSASNLNGTYVFSVSGTDVNGAPLAIVGTFTANGQKGITAGTLDLNDPEFTPSTTLPNTPVTSGSSYTIGVDGRGQITLAANTPFGSNLVFDFVLQDSSHGLITEFDNNATGSGTLDLQSSGVSPTGTYAFIFSGAAVNLSASTEAPWAMVGNFTVGAGGAITGLEDSNIDGLATTDLTLGGSLVLGPSSTPATTFTPSSGTGQTYDVYAIDANHLKFIEMDTSGTLVGDAYSQGSTTVTASTYAFVLEGAYPTSDVTSAAGGFIVTDGDGNITSASTMDANNGGNGVVSTANFTGNYAAAGTGRYTLTNLSGFEGTEYAAYPFSGGWLLLEIDDSGIMSGAAYPQTQNAFASAQGYALNLTGTNLAQQQISGSIVEVDDIAEFAANSTGTTITGLLDENYAPGGSPNYGLPFSMGTYTAPDTNGRGQISTAVGNSNTTTLNGGFSLNFYSVDGTSFPCIETDGNGQVTAGVFLEQNSSTATPAKAPSHLFVVRPMVKPRTFKRKLQ